MLEENIYLDIQTTLSHSSAVTDVDVAIVWEMWNQNKQRRWCASYPNGLPLRAWEGANGRLPASHRARKGKSLIRITKNKDTKQYLKYSTYKSLDYFLH